VTTFLVATTSHNNLSNRGAASLCRMIDSVRAARRELERSRQARMIWSWVDDGSTDGTAAWLARRLRPDHGELLTANQTNCYAAVARNMAVARRHSDLVNIFDSDDEMLPNHLVVGYDMLLGQDSAGLRLGTASTLTDFADSGAIDPEWSHRISMVNVNTTFYHRAVWDFVEGMPTLRIYQTVGCEDQDLMAMLQIFFPTGMINIVTARYWRYDGSTFDRQLSKFKRSPDADTGETATDSPAARAFNAAREAHMKYYVQYLKTKLLHMPDRTLFNGLRTGTAFIELGLSY
jgi:hypothetical protein